MTEPPKSSFFRTVKMISWAFLGLRKDSEFKQDIKMNPLHILAAGLIGGFLFVFALVGLVYWIV